MIHRTPRAIFFFLLATYFSVLFLPISSAQAAPPSVRLTPIPLGSTPEQIQALVATHRNVYFYPGTYNIGTLTINGWNGGVIWGAGRLTTNLVGRIAIANSSNVTIGNLNTYDPSISAGEAVVSITGTQSSAISLISFFASATTARNSSVVFMGAPGELLLQGTHISNSDVGLTIDHPQAHVNIFGGNYQNNRLHIYQKQGHLDARAFGVQVALGGVDIRIETPSPAATGFHLIEAVRSEGSNGRDADETFLYVPETAAAVHVALRANSLTAMAQYADYNANGTLLLLSNANYPGNEDSAAHSVSAHSPGAARIISMGNKLGNSFNSGKPFDVAGQVTVSSTGDMWMLNNAGDYSAHWTLPITHTALTSAGKTLPETIQFTAEGTGTAAFPIPIFPSVTVADVPKITNLHELMTSVREFGAIPNDGIDDYQAIQNALLATLHRGISDPLYFPAGRYELSHPLFVDHYSGGGFWGDGHEQSVLVSTSGEGVLTTDGAGYSTFVDIGFENKPGADTATVNFSWQNMYPSDPVLHPSTGAALQANMFYRTRFEYGGQGLAIGYGMMGSEFMIVDSVFRHMLKNGGGYGIASHNFNALTNTVARSTFDDVDFAIASERGTYHSYGNHFSRIARAGLLYWSVVSDGFMVSDTTMDASPVPLVISGHSSSAAHILVERSVLQAPAAAATVVQYGLGGTVTMLDSVFPNRIMTGGGGIGDSAMIADRSLAAQVHTSGWSHPYFFSRSAAAPVGNSAPVAHAGTDAIIVLPTTSTTLAGSGTDAEGAIARYAWTQVSGAPAVIASAASAETAITNLAAGTYTFRLTVTDSGGLSASDDVDVIVQSAAEDPGNTTATISVDAGDDQTVRLPATTAVLAGAGTIQGGTLQGYLWTKVSGGAATLASPTALTTTITGLEEGTYVFRLTVTATSGKSVHDDIEVSVKEAVSSLEADAGANKTITLPLDQVTLTGSGADATAAIAEYRWRQTSGPVDAVLSSTTAASTTVSRLTRAGTYKFRLTVKNTKGQSDHGSVTVTVLPGAAAPSGESTVSTPTVAEDLVVVNVRTMLKIRASPEGPIIARTQGGVIGTVLMRGPVINQLQWIKVQFAPKIAGWVSHYYLLHVQRPAAATAKVRVIPTLLPIRSVPGGVFVGQAPRGTSGTVLLTTAAGWVKVRFENGFTGYVLRSYLENV